MKVDLKKHDMKVWTGFSQLRLGVQCWDRVNMVTDIWGYTEGRES
jgi:hypothetical protein